MTRYRALAALVLAVGLGGLSAGTASADTTGDQTTVCTRTLVCAPVNAPLDLNTLLNVGSLLGGGLGR